MSAPPDPSSSQPEADPSKTIRRLERRLERERQSRLEAERIADEGMRNLWLANRELDERVAARTAELATTLDELHVAITARERFLSTLSHEMRTPLNGVLGMLELLEPYIADPQGGRYLASAIESADGLSTLLRRLLDLVELQARNITANVSPVATRDLTSRIQARWLKEAMRSGHLLVVQSFVAEDQIETDAERLLQIVDELIDNAVAHATPGTVDVRLSDRDGWLIVEVEDTGPGMDDDTLGRIFQPNASDVESTRLTQGLGLGLSLSRRLAELLGGSLDIVRIEHGNGSAATLARLEFPIAANTRMPSQAPESDAA